MKRSRLVDSFNCAVEGLLYVLKTQRNMKIHLLVGIAILFSCIIFKVSVTDFLFITFAIAFILVCEMINTGIELLSDLLVETYHPLVRIVKDVAAGAVLIASVNAVVTGYLLLYKYISGPIEIGVGRILEIPWYWTFLCLFGVMIVAIVIKIFLHRGTPFSGGMPSAHAAMAFSIWMMVSLISKQPIVVALTFVASLMVAQSRVASGIHSFKEVFAGGVLGVLFTLMFFQLLSKF
ncbi:MAG: diacylglycerol kinase [Candidatus Theseobacter exili]|nr:diacylglycerol kinase [Candidatus Theseobacter exili]